MAKSAPDAMLDASLDYAAAATIQHLCSAQPANFAGIAAVSLASVAMAPGDFTKADGDTSGRKLTVAAKAAVPITTSGTANHVVLATTTGSVLRYVSTVASQQLTSGGTVDIGSWKIEVADPS